MGQATGQAGRSRGADASGAQNADHVCGDAHGRVQVLQREAHLQGGHVKEERLEVLEEASQASRLIRLASQGRCCPQTASVSLTCPPVSQFPLPPF